jgi:hypothetical protein
VSIPANPKHKPTGVEKWPDWLRASLDLHTLVIQLLINLLIVGVMVERERSVSWVVVFLSSVLLSLTFTAALALTRVVDVYRNNNPELPAGRRAGGYLAVYVLVLIVLAAGACFVVAGGRWVLGR